MERRDRILRILVVSIVTLVLWVWANNSTTETLTFDSEVSVVLPASLRETGELLSPRDPFVASLVCAGPEAALEEARRRLTDVRLVAGQGGLPDGITQVDMPLQDVLQAILDAASIDVRVRSVDSTITKLQVDLLTRTTMHVTPLMEGVRVEGQPVAKPAQADLFLPGSLKNEVSRLRLEAVVDPAQIAGKEGGRRHTVSAPVRAVAEAGVTLPDRLRIEPATVEVSFTLAGRTVNATLASEGSSAPGIPVQLALPPKDLDRYAVTLDPQDSFLRNVVVSGPPEVIDQINQGRAKIIAFVQLSSDDLDRAALSGGSIEKPVSLWQLPPGVTVVDPGKTDYQIEQSRNPDKPRRSGIRIGVKAVGST